jgi:hypothetical protein
MDGWEFITHYSLRRCWCFTPLLVLPYSKTAIIYDPHQQPTLRVFQLPDENRWMDGNLLRITVADLRSVVGVRVLKLQLHEKETPTTA